MAQKSRDLIEAMHAIAKAAHPITGRGVGYKLFTQGLTESMSRNEMQRVYRLLKTAREEGTIPWGWIVDETRSVERVSTCGWWRCQRTPVAGWASGKIFLIFLPARHSLITCARLHAHTAALPGQPSSIGLQGIVPIIRCC